jgi:purine-binding chemotaxis protein CheW
LDKLLNPPRAPLPLPGSAAEAAAVSHVLIFKVETREYALSVHQVVEVVRMVAITPLPEAPPWVDGVLNFRGRIVPVVDLRARLGISRREPDLSTPIVITVAEAGLFGLVADELIEVLPVSGHQLDASNGQTPASPAVAAMVRHRDRLLLVLDPDRLHDRPVEPA